MLRVILFGAGDGGLRLKYILGSDFEIVAYVDDDHNKVGKRLEGIKIISPDSIQNFEYDYIIISCRYGDIIKPKLVDKYHVNKDKIIDYYFNGAFDTRLAYLRLISDEIYENKIKGNVAELGVFLGDFAKEINILFPDRKLYLFDTFEGFAENDVSLELNMGLSDSKIGQFRNENIELVISKMKYPENCIVKKGYFPQTAEGLEDGFSFVSIDADLFNPIYEGLKYFYPRLSPGGYILIHDYNSTLFHGVKEAVGKFCKENHVCYFPLVDLCGSIAITK